MSDTTQPLVGHELVHPTRYDVAAGAIAGQVAGLAMAVVMVAVFALFLGKPWYFPVQVIGAFALGDVGVQGGFHLPSFLAGLVLHQLGPSLFWGVVFGLVVHALRTHTAGGLLVIGLAIGIISQVIDVSLLIPWLYTRLQGHDIWSANVPNSWSTAAHVVYGLTLATLGWIRPAVEPRTRVIDRTARRSGAP
jgi:hypothetical protein